MLQSILVQNLVIRRKMMIKEKVSCLVLSLLMALAVVGQTTKSTANSTAPTKRVESAATATSTTASAISGISGLYSWQIRPDDNDGYFSSDIPQPVCGMVGGVAKIFVFTNFDFYSSINFHNYSNGVRVGEITTPADTYQLLSHSLPGARQEFAATSVLRPIDSNHTMYIFGGRNLSGDLDEVYSYTPGTGVGAGFKLVTHIPARNGKAGARAGAVALPSKGMIYLFGGAQNGNTVLDQVLEFDPATEQFTNKALPPMPDAFHGARGMTKAVGVANYIYLVGAKTAAYGAPNDLIYRFDVQNGTTLKVMDQQNPSQKLRIPIGSGYPMITWDPSGNIRIIAASGNGSSGLWTWGNIQAWILQDDYSSTTTSLATFAPAPYNNSARARDMAGAVKCGSSTYLIGGTYGHGTTFQNRGMLVDRLAASTYGRVKAVDVKAISIKTP